jgi:hypothetical protein
MSKMNISKIQQSSFVPDDYAPKHKGKKAVNQLESLERRIKELEDKS